MKDGGLGRWNRRLCRWIRVTVVLLTWRAGWDRTPCWWCGEEMRWSLESPAETSRVGRAVHAECLELADREEAPWS